MRRCRRVGVCGRGPCDRSVTPGEPRGAAPRGVIARSFAALPPVSFRSIPSESPVPFAPAPIQHLRSPGWRLVPSNGSRGGPRSRGVKERGSPLRHGPRAGVVLGDCVTVNAAMQGSITPFGDAVVTVRQYCLVELASRDNGSHCESGGADAASPRRRGDTADIRPWTLA